MTIDWRCVTSVFLENVILVENIQQPFAVPNVTFIYAIHATLKQPQKDTKELENAQDAKNH